MLKFNFQYQGRKHFHVSSLASRNLSSSPHFHGRVRLLIHAEIKVFQTRAMGLEPTQNLPTATSMTFTVTCIMDHTSDLLPCSRSQKQGQGPLFDRLPCYSPSFVSEF
jgi:hypothetical protein